jgi:hypothetical protein
LAGTRLPVTYTIAPRQILWGKRAGTVDVVQQQAAWRDGCKPLGSAACEPPLPAGDAFWVLMRDSDGVLRAAGRCGLMLAPYFLKLARQSPHPTAR